MYQTNIKVVHLLEESPIKYNELIQGIGVVRGGHRKSKIIKNGQKSQRSAPFLPDGTLSNTPNHVKNIYYIYII